MLSRPEPLTSSVPPRFTETGPALRPFVHGCESQKMTETGAVVSAVPGDAASEPPITWCIVFTTVPELARACSHVRKSPRTVVDVEYGSQALSQIWWNTTGTRPPLACSARVT